MSYTGQRTVYDADSHLMELPNFLTDHVEPDNTTSLPDLGEILSGTFDAQKFLGKSQHEPSYAEELVALGDNLTRGPKWHEALGAFSGQERSRALDLLGFQRQIIFSSFCARLIFDAPSNKIAYTTASAHNKAMANFCAGDPRLMGVAMVPLQDVELALKEIGSAAKAGLAGVWISADAPGGRSPGHIEHEPIWALLAESNMPFILHVGSAPIAIEDAWMNDGNANTVTARGGAEVIGSKDLTVIHHASQRFISTLILDGVLERHPLLKGAVVEIGAGWVPDMLRRLDAAVEIWSRAEPALAQMKRSPSQQAIEQLRFTPYPFEDVGQLISESHPELYMFSSDYPHAEGGRDPLGRFSKAVEHLDKQIQHQFFAQNFKDLFNLA